MTICYSNLGGTRQKLLPYSPQIRAVSEAYLNLNISESQLGSHGKATRESGLVCDCTACVCHSIRMLAPGFHALNVTLIMRNVIKNTGSSPKPYSCMSVLIKLPKIFTLAVAYLYWNYFDLGMFSTFKLCPIYPSYDVNRFYTIYSKSDTCRERELNILMLCHGLFLACITPSQAKFVNLLLTYCKYTHVYIHFWI